MAQIGKLILQNDLQQLRPIVGDFVSFISYESFHLLLADLLDFFDKSDNLLHIVLHLGFDRHHFDVNLMVAEVFVVVALIYVLEVEEVVFDGGVIYVSAHPFSDDRLFVVFLEFLE